MNWWIEIGVYKMKSGNYFILNIPNELKEVGYSEECYEEDSILLVEEEIKKLDNENFGYYSLKLKPVNNKLSYAEVIEEAKKNKWNLFIIEDFTKRV